MRDSVLLEVPDLSPSIPELRAWAVSSTGQPGPAQPKPAGEGREKKASLPGIIYGRSKDASRLRIAATAGR